MVLLKDCWQIFIGTFGLSLGILLSLCVGNMLALFSVPEAWIIDPVLLLSSVWLITRCLCTVHILSSSLLQVWSCISSSGKRSLLTWGIQTTKSCFPLQWINHGTPWLHLMQMRICICKVNHFSGLNIKHWIFINKDMTVIALVDFGPGKSQPQ